MKGLKKENERQIGKDLCYESLEVVQKAGLRQERGVEPKTSAGAPDRPFLVQSPCLSSGTGNKAMCQGFSSEVVSGCMKKFELEKDHAL
jgi:hypothetical protein